MKLFKPFKMGRRQFLAAAGVGSASALALGKLRGMMYPAFQTQAAMAARLPEERDEPVAHSVLVVGIPRQSL